VAVAAIRAALAEVEADLAFHLLLRQLADNPDARRQLAPSVHPRAGPLEAFWHDDGSGFDFGVHGVRTVQLAMVAPLQAAALAAVVRFASARSGAA
jgi:hypothetical protein